MTHDDTATNGDGGESGREVVRYDLSEFEQPTTAVVRAVAEATGRDPTSMPPLHESVDTDALNNLVRGGTRRSGSSLGVSFSYAGMDVIIDAEGTVAVTPRSEAAEG